MKTITKEASMRNLIAITIIAGLLLVLSTAPSYSHGVNWGVSVNLGGIPYYGYAPAYPVYPTYVYYPPPPVYPVYRAGFGPPPRHYYHGRFDRPYRAYHYGYPCR